MTQFPESVSCQRSFLVLCPTPVLVPSGNAHMPSRRIADTLGLMSFGAINSSRGVADTHCLLSNRFIVCLAKA